MSEQFSSMYILSKALVINLYTNITDLRICAQPSTGDGMQRAGPRSQPGPHTAHSHHPRTHSPVAASVHRSHSIYHTTMNCVRISILEMARKDINTYITEKVQAWMLQV